MARRGISVAVLAIATVAAIVVPGAAAGQPATRVVGGEEAAAGTYPYLAWIYYGDEIDHRACSGSVVASNLVLTAAHCVLRNDLATPVDPAHFTVVTGNVHHLAQPHTTSTVTSFAVAPNYRTEYPINHPVAGDAAVLILAQPTPAPALRLAGSKAWGVGTAVTFAGWGETGTPNPGDGLRVGEGTVQPDSYCAAHTPTYDPAELLCAQGPGRKPLLGLLRRLRRPAVDDRARQRRRTPGDRGHLLRYRRLFP